MNRISHRQRLMSEINITPFTDVILVLLIIFMIATPLIFQSSIPVSLPHANSGKPAGSVKKVQVYITITNEGLIYLDDKQVSRSVLKKEIDEFRKDNPGLSVILRSDKMVRFKDIVAILDPLNELGITKLAIATTEN